MTKKYLPLDWQSLCQLCDDENISLGDIDTSQITDMSSLFANSTRQDYAGIEGWNVSKVSNMNYMFKNSNFDGDLSQWNTSNVTHMKEMFLNSPFKGDLSSWDVSKVRWFEGMFQGTEFNGNISSWDVSSAVEMGSMFKDSKFQGDLSCWDVSKVQNFSHMFENSIFNGDLAAWDVSAAVNMTAMFSNSKFNGNLSHWEVDNVQYMGDMFSNSQFNGVISGWQVKKCNYMHYMFAHSKFDQDLSNWELQGTFWGMFEDCPISFEHLPSAFKQDFKQNKLKQVDDNEFMFLSGQKNVDHWLPEVFKNLPPIDSIHNFVEDEQSSVDFKILCNIEGIHEKYSSESQSALNSYEYELLLKTVKSNYTLSILYRFCDQDDRNQITLDDFKLIEQQSQKCVSPKDCHSLACHMYDGLIKPAIKSAVEIKQSQTLIL